MAEDEMVGWYHQLNGHEFEQTLGDSEEQRSLLCYSPGSLKELDTTQLLNNSSQLCSGCENHSSLVLARLKLDDIPVKSLCYNKPT